MLIRLNAKFDAMSTALRRPRIGEDPGIEVGFVDEEIVRGDAEFGAADAELEKT